MLAAVEERRPIPELEAMSLQAANAFRPFMGEDGFDLEQYKQFLNTMFHYTGRSGEMIQHAGNLAHDDVLKAFFTRMVSEEKGHYILAQEDLRALGGDVSETIPQSVLDFHHNWFNLGDTIYAYLGAIYVFENIAKHLQQEGVDMFARLNLNKKQRRWVAVHLEADLMHGEEIIALCAQYYDQDQAACLKGGEVMCRSWINVFTQFGHA